MSAFYDLNKTPRNILNQAIVRAIISENNGALFDPSDLSTLYQDAAGTTPVTAVEQPVGKMLDKSGNGYHATQPITASRPVLSARYNLLTKTEDFSNAVWTKVAGGTGTAPSITNNYDIAPDGSQTAIRVQLNKGAGTTSSSLSAVYQSSSSVVSQSYSRLCYVKLTDGAESCRVHFDDISAVGGTSVTITNTWTLINLSTTARDIARGFRVICRGGFNTTDTADFLIWHPQYVLTGYAGPYQRVNTATDYDTDERYFKKFLKFDGVDNYLNLPYMGLYENGSASVVMGVDDRTQTGNSRAFSESSSTTSSQYSIRNLTSGGFDSYVVDDAGAPFVDTLNTKGTESKNYIISVVDTGTNITRYRNSTSENAQSYSRAGKSFTANKTTIGALDTMNTVVAYTAMNLYGLIITKSALTDAQRIACERHLSRKAGVTL